MSSVTIIEEIFFNWLIWDLLSISNKSKMYLISICTNSIKSNPLSLLITQKMTQLTNTRVLDRDLKLLGQYYWTLLNQCCFFFWQVLWKSSISIFSRIQLNWTHGYTSPVHLVIEIRFQWLVYFAGSDWQLKTKYFV